jgi:hypothetical protein
MIAIYKTEPKRLNSKLGGKKIMANSKAPKKSTKLGGKKLEKKTTLTTVHLPTIPGR